MKNHLDKLQRDHAHLSRLIEAEQARPEPDPHRLASMKRHRLMKKDEVVAFRKQMEGR